MRMSVATLLAMALLGPVCRGGETATLVKTRLQPGAAAKPNVWLSSFSKAKAYAAARKLPLVAVWSNGDACSHCVRFESACNSSAFRTWMKTSGMVFYFTYPKDGGDGRKGSSVFNWIRKSNTSYPFVRIWWPAGDVDYATVGDILDGYQSGSAGGKKVAAAIKARCKGFKPSSAVVRPYTVAFDPNGGTGTMADKRAEVGVKFTLPANAFKRADHSFTGWAKTPTGAKAYANKASVKNLTTVSNGVVTLYAKWTRTTYRTYYVGLKSTVQMSSGLKGATTSSKVPGLKWSPSKYRWTGTPTKAGTYTVKLKKNGKTYTRKIVIVKDSLVWADGAIGMLFATGRDLALDLSPTSAAGALRSVEVSGLPDGLEYADGAVSGSTSMRGVFTLKVSAVSAAGQKLARAYKLSIGVPECCIGTFNGFVGFAAPSGTTDELALSNRGSFRLAAPEDASLSAKVVTAKGTYSLTGIGWHDNGDGTYTALLASADGRNSVRVTAGEGSPPYESIREIGVFTPSYGTEYGVWAQRAPFARNADGSYADPVVGAAMGKVVGTWRFRPYAVGSQWVLLYATAKTATLTLTVAADGTAKLAGKVGSYAVSASSAVFVFAGDLEDGCVRADFPVPVTVSKKRKTLDIWTNLWFDRSNDHFNTRGEGVGGAAVEDFN